MSIGYFLFSELCVDGNRISCREFSFTVSSLWDTLKLKYSWSRGESNSILHMCYKNKVGSPAQASNLCVSNPCFMYFSTKIATIRKHNPSSNIQVKGSFHVHQLFLTAGYNLHVVYIVFGGYGKTASRLHSPFNLH